MTKSKKAKREQEENHNIYAGLHEHIIPTLIEIMENKDQVTLLHSSRVQRLIDIMIPRLIQEKIIGQDEIPLLWVAAIVHDIGKIFVEDKILESENKLDKFEYRIIRFHPVRGYHLLKEFDLPKKILLAVRHHHERWDGKTHGRYPGYPDGLKGKQIPLYARIISLADAYDAMVSERPYKKRYLPVKALQIIQKAAGRQFDPKLVKIFVPVISEELKKNLKL
ncbi:MAG: HD domain-containing protein [Spirochaetes bacterium]|nr:HD domain-containing protein [Spirochaetota bacterium]